MKPLRIAALVKQVPKFEEMQLTPDGRLQRQGLELFMNPYCLRAVSKGIDLAQQTGGSCTVISLGPPAAEDVVRWGIAGGATEGWLISDPVFAGSDTLATARALAAALQRVTPFDLILVGKNSVDADTGQVGPELAELLDYPFASAARTLELTADGVRLGCEHDDAWIEAQLTLPAVISVAERLCPPLRAEPAERAAVAADKILRLGPADLGSGPWGQAGSPTRVGETRLLEVKRARQVLTGPLPAQIAEAMTLLSERQALTGRHPSQAGMVPAAIANPVATVAVILEPERPTNARELLGAAAGIAARLHGRVVVFQSEPALPAALAQLASWGADHVVALQHTGVAEDSASFIADWCRARPPWGILAPSTSWGREVASRVAARLQAGLTGDAIALDLEDRSLVCWKPAFGGRLVAAVRATSSTQMATLRPGVLPRLTPRAHTIPTLESHTLVPRSRLQLVSRQQNDQLDRLALASRVVGVGAGVAPERYRELAPLLHVLKAELAATRKVTDQDWLPHARQIGITGRSIAPDFYLALGISGRFNHTCGMQASGTVLAINTDPKAPMFEQADIGIVADWAECVPLLVQAFAGMQV